VPRAPAPENVAALQSAHAGGITPAMTSPDPPYLEDLGPDALRRAGVPAPFVFGRADMVRFGEIDALGHVNNTAYLRWFETLRQRYIEARGLHDYGDGSFGHIVVRRTEADFLREMRLGAGYVVATRTEALRRTSFTMSYTVRSGGEECARGLAVVVLLDANGAKHPLPAAVRRRLIEIDGAAEH